MWSTLFFRRVIGVYCFLLLLLAACVPEKETNVQAARGAPLTEATTISTVTTPAVATTTVATTEAATATPVATFAITFLPTPVATLPADLPVIAPENAAGLTQVARFGKGRIDSIAWSADGTTFAVAGPTGIYLYDAETLQELRAFDAGGDAAINDARFSPQGDVLALLRCREGVCFVELWQTASGQLIRTFSTLDQLPVFTTDGQTIIFVQSADSRTPPLVWQDVHTGETQRTVQLKFLQCCVLILSPGGDMLAEVGGTARLWDTASGQVRHTIAMSSTLAAFSPQSDLLAGVYRNGVRLWDVKGGQLLHALERHTGSVENIVFSPDGRILAIGSAGDRTVQLWDTTSGQLRHVLTDNNGESVAFSPDGRQLAVVGGGSRVWGGSKVLFYDTETGQLLRTLAGYNITMGVAFTPDGNSLIAAGGYDAQTWDVHSGQLRQAQASDIPIWSIAVSPDGSLMAWAGGKHQYVDGDEQLHMVQMWDLATGQLLYTLQEQGGVVFEVLFSPDGQLLATWNDVNSLVKLRQARNGELLFSQHARSVAFHPHDRLFAIGVGDIYNEKGDVSLQLWDVDTFELVRSVEGLQRPVTFTADGNIVATNDTGTKGLWHTGTGDLLLPFTGGDVGTRYDPHVAALSPDGRMLALRNQFDSLELWDMSTGQALWASGHVTSAAFSPDGRLLATGNRDGTLSLWGLRP